MLDLKTGRDPRQLGHISLFEAWPDGGAGTGAHGDAADTAAHGPPDTASSRQE